ncbi:hypothetical protein [Mucilaginibacter sp. L196]|nr:hypothetical protein [Mucilaginibacter sp. L196]
MKRRFVTNCLGIGLNMFFPEYVTRWVNPMELVNKNLSLKKK